jgi:enoyl-CoA hydratase
MRGIFLDYDGALKLEAELSSQIFQTEDAKEGPRAFAEKRPPQWKGR